MATTKTLTGNFTASPGDRTFNTFLILIGVGAAGYMLYSYGKLKTEQSGEITKPVGGVDFSKATQDKTVLKDAAQSIIDEAQGFVNDEVMIAAVMKCKSDYDVEAMYALCGKIDGWLLFDGDMFYQLRRTSDQARKTIRGFLFGYGSQV